MKTELVYKPSKIELFNNVSTKQSSLHETNNNDHEECIITIKDIQTEKRPKASPEPPAKYSK